MPLLWGKSGEKTPPYFIDGLAGITRLHLGQRAEVSIKVGGYPKPSVYWFKIIGNQRVKLKGIQGVRKFTKKHGRHTLALDKVSLRDEGEYQIVAENSSGVVECSTRIRVVQHQLEIRSTSDQNVEVRLNEDASFSVSISGNSEDCKIRWFKDNAEEPLEDDGRLEVVNTLQNSRITIKSCVLADTGCYKCIAEGRGKVRKVSFQLNVKGPSEQQKTSGSLSDLFNLSNKKSRTYKPLDTEHLLTDQQDDFPNDVFGSERLTLKKKIQPVLYHSLQNIAAPYYDVPKGRRESHQLTTEIGKDGGEPPAMNKKIQPVLYHSLENVSAPYYDVPKGRRSLLTENSLLDTEILEDFSNDVFGDKPATRKKMLNPKMSKSLQHVHVAAPSNITKDRCRSEQQRKQGSLSDLFNYDNKKLRKNKPIEKESLLAENDSFSTDEEDVSPLVHQTRKKMMNPEMSKSLPSVHVPSHESSKGRSRSEQDRTKGSLSNPNNKILRKRKSVDADTLLAENDLSIQSTNDHNFFPSEPVTRKKLMNRKMSKSLENVIESSTASKHKGCYEPMKQRPLNDNFNRTNKLRKWESTPNALASNTMMEYSSSLAFDGFQGIQCDAPHPLLDDIVDDAKKILVSALKYSEKKELERPLEQIIIDIPVWENLCYKLIDAKLIHLSENAIKLIKHPNCRKIGRYFLEALKVISPNLTVKELNAVAFKNNRYDICDFLESYDDNHLVVNIKDKSELCILCSIPVQHGANWMALAEDLDLTKTQRARIASSAFVSSYEQVMDMFDSFEYSNPHLNLYDLICSLQQLHAIDALQTLITIIRERRKDRKETISPNLYEDLNDEITSINYKDYKQLADEMFSVDNEKRGIENSILEGEDLEELEFGNDLDFFDADEGFVTSQYYEDNEGYYEVNNEENYDGPDYEQPVDGSNDTTCGSFSKVHMALGAF